ncbi:tyrosyl-DNA phosphodiesterase-domain-containing protein [Mycena albidolilacea]|uniref:Tyrosyl-DNA phosphodiesterase-domain-containing protein n=1 Tax=Mycena albidolilacea TaxID=1033008 RepID=A0AAD7AK15_9AGAR|nr:tyrosyl-DNA phosphodiesterase-domain-containing protein [Mycena albidolilacea]
MDAFSGEMLDGQEEYEIMKAFKLSLQDERNYLVRRSHALTSSMMAGSYTSSSASTRTKRPLDSSADSVQEKKKRKLDLHTEALKLKIHTVMAEYNRSNSAPPPLPMKYASGALRLTRMPGRQHAPNAISLDDLIHPQNLSSALVYSVFIEDPDLFDIRPFLSLLCRYSNLTCVQFFPFETSCHRRPYVNVYVGRDIAMDADGKQSAGCKPKTKQPKPADFDRVVELAKKRFREQYGNNFHAIYSKLQSGAHSKIMVLAYPEFMRVVITSANLMQCDTDFPRLSDGAAYTETPFERRLRKHVSELEYPPDFIRQYLKAGVFDFSAAKVRLVTSESGSFSGERAYESGQLRMRKVVRNLLKKRCVGSVGHLENEGVVSNFLESCAGNLPESIEGEPALKMIFPTTPDVRASRVRHAGNISSHINWNALEEKNAGYLKDVFHHYCSRDRGSLFHLKSILALHRHSSTPKHRPMYIYLGSANFSSSAWGKVEREGRNGVIAATLRTERLEKVANFECGVVVRGEDMRGCWSRGAGGGYRAV